MAKQFPKDCTKDCPYYHCWDLSIDDYTNICDKLGVQVDDMDAYGVFYIPLNCPLDTTKEGEESVESEPTECEDTISRKHLLSEIDELMQSPWFNNGKDFYDGTITHYGYTERKEAVEIVRDLCVKTEPSVTPVFRWIPIKKNPFSELPKDRRVWVTKEDSYGYRYVSDVAWDLKKFDDDVMNVVAYMDYYEPEPYKEGEE